MVWNLQVLQVLVELMISTIFTTPFQLPPVRAVHILSGPPSLILDHDQLHTALHLSPLLLQHHLCSGCPALSGTYVSSYAIHVNTPIGSRYLYHRYNTEIYAFLLPGYSSSPIYLRQGGGGGGSLPWSVHFSEIFFGLSKYTYSEYIWWNLKTYAC